MPRGRKKGWAERGEKGGRPKGSFKEGAAGRVKKFKTFSVACSEEEYQKVKEKASQSGLTVSRFLIDTALNDHS